MARTIKVYSTKTGTKTLEVADFITTLGELKEILDKEGIDYNGMKMIENQRNSNLEHNDAKLPEGNFLIMMTPIKTKSGTDMANMSRKEIYALVKEEMAKDPKAADHFNKDKNYTNKSTALLIELYEEWTGDSAAGEDLEEAEVVEESEITIDSIEEWVMNREDYDENSAAYDRALELLRDPSDYNDEEDEPALTDDEEDWINSMS